MTHVRFLLLAAGLVAGLKWDIVAQADEAFIALEAGGPGQAAQRFVVSGISPEVATVLKSDSAAWKQVFAVTVDSPLPNPPPVLGRYSWADGQLVFEPRFPLQPGVKYRADWEPASAPQLAGLQVPGVSREFLIEKPEPAPAAKMLAIFPSRDVLPENQLKLYLHFSAPMSRGEAYRHVHLLNEAGEEVAHPFLELGEELWDPAGTRFTLFFDPGRIKRGLKPRELFGPSLEQGRRYRLVVDAAWSDADGQPLVESATKEFQVGPVDEQQPSVGRWQVHPPASDNAPLTVNFDEPLDHAMLLRVLAVQREAGDIVPGRITVANEETRWTFTPNAPWSEGRYRLVIDTTLEDLAGNSLGQLFEVDVFRAIDRAVRSETVNVPFEVRFGTAAERR